MMADVRETYWIAKHRQLSKQLIRKCFGCKTFQVRPFPTPPTGNLPKEVTKGSIPFEVAGADFAGPIYYTHRL